MLMTFDQPHTGLSYIREASAALQQFFPSRSRMPPSGPLCNDRDDQDYNHDDDDNLYDYSHSLMPPSGPLYNDNLIMIMIMMMAIMTMIIMGRGGGLFQSKKDHCMFVHIHDKCDDDYRKITNMTTSVMIMMMITIMPASMNPTSKSSNPTQALPSQTHPRLVQNIKS